MNDRPAILAISEEEQMVPAPNSQTILYATDLGDNTRPVFRLAVSQARRYNARLLMLHVVEPLGSTGTAIIANYLSGETADRINQDMASDILEVMKKRLDAYCKEEMAAFGLDRTPVTDILVVSGNPSEEILAVAQKYHADMIVMGTSTRSFLGSVIMGTTARRVSRHSTLPVLLVPRIEK
jgi:nucleotide-binding universal stress UspA family protein